LFFRCTFVAAPRHPKPRRFNFHIHVDRTRLRTRHAFLSAVRDFQSAEGPLNIWARSFIILTPRTPSSASALNRLQQHSVL
jgi:hypothetical protein